MFVLYRNEDVSGIYTDYRTAVHAMMYRAKKPLQGMKVDMEMDFYYFNDPTDPTDDTDIWCIEEFEVDKI